MKSNLSNTITPHRDDNTHFYDEKIIFLDDVAGAIIIE